MSQPTSLHKYVDDKFKEAFGKPHNSMGDDDHWRLQGAPPNLPINVLLNGTRDTPALWVFDPHDPHKEVFKASITKEDQVDGLIEQIQERVNRTGGSADAGTKNIET